MLIPNNYSSTRSLTRHLSDLRLIAVHNTTACVVCIAEPIDRHRHRVALGLDRCATLSPAVWGSALWVLWVQFPPRGGHSLRAALSNQTPPAQRWTHGHEWNKQALESRSTNLLFSGGLQSELPTKKCIETRRTPASHPRAANKASALSPPAGR